MDASYHDKVAGCLRKTSDSDYCNKPFYHACNPANISLRSVMRSKLSDIDLCSQRETLQIPFENVSCSHSELRKARQSKDEHSQLTVCQLEGWLSSSFAIWVQTATKWNMSFSWSNLTGLFCSCCQINKMFWNSCPTRTHTHTHATWTGLPPWLHHHQKLAGWCMS